MGRGSNANVIKKLAREKKIRFLGQTETKAFDLNKMKVGRLWVDDEFQRVKVDAVNMSGGLLCI